MQGKGEVLKGAIALKEKGHGNSAQVPTYLSTKN